MISEQRCRSGGLALVLGLSLSLGLSGCGGWIRSRLPDPNAKSVEEQATVSQGGTPVEVPMGVENQNPAPVEPAVAEVTPAVAEPTPVEPVWEMPEEVARELDWRVFRADARDSSVPSIDARARVEQFVDGSDWRTLSEGESAQALGVIRAGKADLASVEKWGPDSGNQAPLFLVVDAHFAGQRITDARYELMIEDDQSRPVRDRIRRLGRHDDAYDRWFVPVSEILGEGALEWVTPQHRFTLKWEFELENKKTFQVSTALRFSVPPPALNRREVREFVNLQADGFQTTQFGSRVAHQEVWENSSARTADLWIQARSEGLGERHDITFRNPKLKTRLAPEIAWESRQLRTVAAYELGEIRVEGGQVIRAPSERSEGEWLRIRVSPGASVRVSWLARLVRADVPSGAELNREEKVRLTWVRVEPCPPVPGCMRPVDHHVNSKRTWRQSGVAAVGRVQKDAFVSGSELEGLEPAALRAESSIHAELHAAEMAGERIVGEYGRVVPSFREGSPWRADQGVASK